MNEKLHAMRHSCAHVLAAAVQKLYPDAKFGVGPVVDNGFYYDISLDKTLSETDLKAIQKEMQKIINQKHEMIREELSLDEGIELFKKMKQDFKVELLYDLKTKGTTKFGEDESADIDINNPEVATIYKTGEFTDLCRGPHVANTSEIVAFKLSKIAGAYWRGNDQNPQMQRIYGLCFETKEDLDAYEKMMEEAKKRDHRKLGQELDLFAFSDLVGPGLPLFTPRGTVMREQLTSFVWEIMKPYGYTKVDIPHIAKSDLYKVSGHWDKFADDIFKVHSDKTDTVFVMKPMNCPHHTQIYASRMRSYRDLPIRYSEVTKVYRDENTGQLQGLSRVRSITQDDAHVFCMMSQVKDEAKSLYEIITKFYAAFEMPLSIRLSIHDEDNMDKYLGGKEVWKKSVGMLEDLLKELGKDYVTAPGEAAFYGPKIDFIATDAIGREWQLATVQLDFNLPERFELEYVDEKNGRERPVMLHRAILGSVERFMGVMIEHYAGAFPMWLAPEQIRIAPVSDDYIDFAKELKAKLVDVNIRVDIDSSTETVGKKIRAAAQMKVPWTIVVGEKEVAGNDLKINVFGQVDDLIIAQDKIVEEAQKAGKMPL
ncbi:threonine--tRNA ligase [Candidatus Uhrbacteria bacterium CG_4_9_14_0_2_um_filter_41_50]|uniref:Threonine--tRNA ligase n=1 Tax=Candidatus Uhrbacteria bacterium CG_4_9_14_0_2_um_filter_41_50 TaxID=1975031 RepID=A0A2M8ENQ1_9BACT|nr:MAG: threonine--tRNA ligase [Candidatus Uhrbacteria bacterium CG_4_10_14_0_2_um_filter_41_21]PJB84393.1 MAG: threonine--tRNA ligase [Candidatus Uhrbacteria bacterium CG_4_9_14_0_8_um_filter_41_16]PJC24374.1 MAG: threonine--tRNA ligase [Candidatus Uhrbacteria bacterium CG_4_9_14_0_2_um_filter_41_50]PJE75264.1 MAG: threonine--tRNA ligase [Candidatus Uhrbacteria bacterium CG10_big_fil_rev_8_21_14_0_10_41_26]